MNDPWDVKSVRQSDQYISCMKINGVPLLPPVLSKECRKEMQYYKLLAKEVEKRISVLRPYVGSDSDSNEDKTDAPEIPEFEQGFELRQEQITAGFDVNIDKITAITNEKTLEETFKHEEPCVVTTDVYNSVTSNVIVKTTENTLIESPKFVIDLSLSINETGKNILETIKIPQATKKVSQRTTSPLELPERDYNQPTKPQKQLLTDVESVRRNDGKKGFTDDIVKLKYNLDRDVTNTFPEIPIKPDGPSSLSSKSFTGSLNDIHTESVKDSQIIPLIRQSSYTVLKPSPQLLAHLEVQSLNTGVEMSAISMSESLSNLHSPSRKRRSWDLESAKVKWSSMALELKHANLKPVPNSNEHVSRSSVKKVQQTTSPSRARSVAPEVKNRRSNVTSKTTPKSDPIHKQKTSHTPVKTTPSTRTIVKDTISPKTQIQKKETNTVCVKQPIISEIDDPASKVRELYEKIQKQQLIQMASLVEKQKREQIMLQQVFEEQNNLLYQQLKTICPKSPIEAKTAWGDKTEDRGPVSLSHIINNNASAPSASSSPVTTTLTETNNYINRCDNVLKKSRDITGNIKRQQPQAKPRSLNGTNKVQSPPSQLDGSRTRTHSPTNRNTSRKLNYDTSISSDHDYEPILTDRTNDTLADLNVTFPSDNSDECQALSVVSNHVCKELVVKRSPNQKRGPLSTDSAIRCLEDTIQHSINTMISNPRVKQGPFPRPNTAKELSAAATIVAYARGYLVRRLMRTERVQSAVQTIRDALLCALQLHQDREGIRGADVDLHRRLIQQITAACYNLHDTFIASSPAERCAMIAADRARRRSIAARPPPRSRQGDLMSQSFSGAFPTRSKRPSTAASLMTQSNYETFSGEMGVRSARYVPRPRRRPWR